MPNDVVQARTIGDHEKKELARIESAIERALGSIGAVGWIARAISNAGEEQFVPDWRERNANLLRVAADELRELADDLEAV